MLRLQKNLHAACVNTITQPTDKLTAGNNPVDQLSAHGNNKGENNSRFIENMERATNSPNSLLSSEKRLEGGYNRSSPPGQSQPKLKTVSGKNFFNEFRDIQVTEDIVATKASNQAEIFSTKTTFSALPVEIVRIIFNNYSDYKERLNNLKNACRAGLIHKETLTDIVDKKIARLAFENIVPTSNSVLDVREITKKVDWELLLLIKDIPDFANMEDKTSVAKIIQQSASFFKWENNNRDLYQLLQLIIEKSQLKTTEINVLFRYFLGDEQALNIISEFMDKKNIKINEKTMSIILKPEHIGKPVVQKMLTNESESLKLKFIAFIKGKLHNLLKDKGVNSKGHYNDYWLQEIACILKRRGEFTKNFLSIGVKNESDTLKHIINSKFNVEDRRELMKIFNKLMGNF